MPTVDLPVGPEPGWEQNEDEDTQKTPAESLVLLQSLRQSRERWLSSIFPRFSSKVRGGKAPYDSPPPHTIQTRGKCDLEIGPHIFPDTVFYEVHYLPAQSQPTPHALQPSAGWQSTTPYGSNYVSNNQPSQPASPRERSSEFDLPTSSTPLISSISGVTTITPHLINQVNLAASSNPILANLLQIAAGGTATPEQLKTLGLLIQSLASSENAQLASQSISQNQPNQRTPIISSSGTQIASTSHSPVKEFDLVIEFREMPSDRWIFPRGPVVFENVTDNDNDVTNLTYSALIKTVLPFDTSVDNGNSVLPNQAPSAKSSLPTEKPVHVATFRLRKIPLATWDTISRWAGGEEKMQRSQEFFDSLDRKDRVYLGHRLSQGSLLSQLQNLVAPTFNLKTLKSGPVGTTRTKRTTTSRKADSSASKKPDNGINLSSQSSKRRKLSRSQHDSVPTQIQCISCKQTDVPLILGGRYCRPCVEAGQGTSTTQPSGVRISESAEERQDHSSSQAPSHIPSSA